MAFKNRFIQGALRLLPIPKHRPSRQKRILTVATTALGDTLWSTPALESLRKSFPNAYLAALTSPTGMQVLNNNPWTDRLHLLKEPVLSHFLSLWNQLYRERFDTVLLFHASQRLVLPLCSLLGASQIVGTAGINKGLDSLLTHPSPNTYQHEIIRRLKMVESIGGQIASERLSLFLEPNDQQMSLPPGKWVAIHPGSKDGFKRWPIEHFREVGRQLKERTGCEILITGSESERDLMNQLAAEIPGAQVLDTSLSIRSFAALLAQVNLLISNDTGPVHLACALGRPVVALYSSTDPELCGPHKAPHATALYKRRTCEPCMKRKCRRPFCLLQIGVSEVVDAALKSLQN